MFEYGITCLSSIPVVSINIQVLTLNSANVRYIGHGLYKRANPSFNDQFELKIDSTIIQLA